MCQTFGTRLNNLQRRAFKKSPAFSFPVPKPAHTHLLVSNSVDGEKIF
jgi:hypothetical protein